MRDKTRGFTLIEILVVMTIIGIVVALVAVRLARGGDKAKQQLTKAGIAQVVGAIQHYSLETGHPPERLDDLLVKPAGVAGWNGPYLDERELLDAWGRKLVYRIPGERREFDVLSFGADGKPGGEGVQADLSGA